MKTTEQTNEIAVALASAQAEMTNPRKDRQARVKSDRADYTYNYADLACVLDVVRPALAKHGIALIQTPEVGAPEVHEHGERIWRTARLVITTRLLHGSGQWIESELVFDVDPDDRVQSMGSVITYLRRYALQSIVGIAAEEDDDGAAAGMNRRQQDEIHHHEQRDERQAPATRQVSPQQRQASAPASKPQPKAQAAPATKGAQPAPAPLEPVKLDEALGVEIALLKKSVGQPVAQKIWDLFKKSDQKIQRLAIIRGANAAIDKINRTAGKAGDRMIAEITIDRADPDNAQGIIDDLARSAGMALPPLATGEDRPPY